MISAPTPLTAQHQLTDFDNGVPSLDDWLKAGTNQGQVLQSYIPLFLLHHTWLITDGTFGLWCWGFFIIISPGPVPDVRRSALPPCRPIWEESRLFSTRLR